MTSRYQRVADDLTRRIRSGEYTEGAQLPGETTLAAHHGVSLPTLRRAFEVLQAKGLIERRHGRGTFVRRRLPRITYGTGRSTADRPVDGELHVLVEAEEVLADDGLVARMKVYKGTALVAYTYLSRWNNLPYSLVRAWVPHDLADLRVRDGEPSPWADDVLTRICASGVRLASKTEQVSVRPPSEEEADRLAVDQRSCVMEIERTSTDVFGRVVEGARVVVPGDRGVAVFKTLHGVEWNEVAP